MSRQTNIHAAWIAAAMKRANLNQQQLARSVKVSETLLSKIRNGHRKPSREVQDSLLRLAGYDHDRYLAGPGGAN